MVWNQKIKENELFILNDKCTQIKFKVQGIYRIIFDACWHAYGHQYVSVYLNDETIATQWGNAAQTMDQFSTSVHCNEIVEAYAGDFIACYMFSDRVVTQAHCNRLRIEVIARAEDEGE